MPLVVSVARRYIGLHSSNNTSTSLRLGRNQDEQPCYDLRAVSPSGMPKSMSDNDLVIAQQSQEKFQFYGVALVFTILGLSIQTAVFDGHIIARVCELVSWLMLLVSGLAGLSHLEWNPVIRMQMVRKDELEAKANQLLSQKNQGVGRVNVLPENKVIPIEQRIEEYKLYVEKLDGQITKLDRRAEIKYQMFKWTFVTGIFLLAAGRSITPIVGIFNEIRKTN